MTTINATVSTSKTPPNNPNAQYGKSTPDCPLSVVAGIVTVEVAVNTVDVLVIDVTEVEKDPETVELDSEVEDSELLMVETSLVGVGSVVVESWLVVNVVVSVIDDISVLEDWSKLVVEVLLKSETVDSDILTVVVVIMVVVAVVVAVVVVVTVEVVKSSDVELSEG